MTEILETLTEPQRTALLAVKDAAQERRRAAMHYATRQALFQLGLIIRRSTLGPRRGRSSWYELTPAGHDVVRHIVGQQLDAAV